MELRQFRYALFVAKVRSFTRAAMHLHVSQSAVSAQIKLLEREIGFSLFQRGTRGVEPTEPGRTFLHEAERIIGDLMNLSETARRLRGGQSETLNLGLVSGAAQIFVPRLFRSLASTMQDIQLRLTTAPTRVIFNDIQEERIDAGIAIESDPDRVPAGLVFDRLLTIEMVLIAHPNHTLVKSKTPIHISALAGEPIVMNELNLGYGQIVLSLFADVGTRPNILAISDNVDTIKTIIASGTGVAIIPRACAEQEMTFRLLKTRSITPERQVAFSLFRHRQPLSRQKETT